MWNTSWAWSIPLIVLTVIIHVIGLGLFNVKMVQILTEARCCLISCSYLRLA